MMRSSATIDKSEEIVKLRHPDWEYSKVRGTAFYFRVAELRDRAYLMGIKLGGKLACWES